MPAACGSIPISAEMAVSPLRPNGGALGELPVVRVEDVRLAVRLEAGQPGRPELRGARVTLTTEGLNVALGFASGLLTRISRERIDGLLTAMEQTPRLRPVRWYYASLFRLGGMQDELLVSGDLFAGGMEIRVRFQREEGGGFLRQLRDRARSVATVTLRLTLAAEDGRLRARVDLSPDVGGLVTRFVLNGVARRPGVERIDDATVGIDLGALLAADPTVPFALAGCVRRVDIDTERAVIEIG